MPHQCTACGHTFEDGSKEMLSGCPDCGGNKFQFRPAGDADEPADSPETTPPTDSEEPDSPPGDATSVAETVGRATTKVRDFVSSDPGAPTDGPEPDAEWPGEWDGQPSPSGGDDDIIDADARRSVDAGGEGNDGEDTAQADARAEIVSPSELTSTGSPDADDELSASPGGDADERVSPDADEPASNGDADGVSPDAEGATPGTPVDGEIVGEPTGEEPDLAELREQLNDQFESIKILEPGQYELNLMELYDREEYIIALQENGRYVIQVPEQWLGEDPDDR